MFAKKALAASLSAEPVFVESVFSTYLYTGNGSTQTITNGIDLSGKGGMVWLKGRSGATDHALYDTARGATKDLVSNSTAAETTQSTGLTAFSGTGFSLGALAKLNTNAATYASWTFRKQAKFFDVVTYTGTGSVQAIPHNLGSVPGFYVVKRTDSTSGWSCYHRSLNGGVNPEDYVIALNSTAAAASAPNEFDTAPTSTHFYVGSSIYTNTSGATYVAYLFAHNAGGFGLSGTDNVISCGSFTTDGSGNATVTLGYEPQWILWKASSGTSNWQVVDDLRGLPVKGVNDARLFPNTSGTEVTTSAIIGKDATGFSITTAVSTTHIYIAIRRGPMKVPTSGTSVLGLSARSGTGANATVSGGQIADAALIKNRGSAVGDLFAARLTGTGYLETSSTAAEVAAGTTILQANPWDVMDGVKVGTTSTITNASSNTFINYLFRRAPGFFDIVCYTGTGVARTINHNLAAVPELMIVRRRSSIANWAVNSQSLTASDYLYLNSTDPKADNTSPIIWNSTRPTSTVFSVGTSALTNENTQTFVAYLFATVAGVSKVFSFTGNGSSQTINCGFTGGARFVMIKRIDSTGDWYVWDSARGIVASNDPHLSLNTTAAEVTTDDSVDADSTGFVVNQNSATNVNVNGATYIGLAVA